MAGGFECTRCGGPVEMLCRRCDTEEIALRRQVAEAEEALLDRRLRLADLPERMELLDKEVRVQLLFEAADKRIEAADALASNIGRRWALAVLKEAAFLCGNDVLMNNLKALRAAIESGEWAPEKEEPMSSERTTR